MVIPQGDPYYFFNSAPVEVKSFCQFLFLEEGNHNNANALPMVLSDSIAIYAYL